jgi:hypothetical protein
MPGVITTSGGNKLRMEYADPNRFNLVNPLHWEEIVGDEEPSESTLTTTESLATLAGYVLNPDLLMPAIVRFLGYSYVENGVTTKFRRHLPMYHPRNPWTRCTRVTVKGEKYDGVTESIYLDSLPIAKYERFRLDAQFEGLPYRVRSDSSVTSEWQRYLTIEPDDASEYIEVQAGQLRYVVPGGGSPHGQPIVGGGRFSVRAERTTLVVTAHGVPWDFICDEFDLPTAFLKAKSKVNSSTFLGKPAGTMLLQDYKPIKKPQPVATVDLDDLYFAADVEMRFGYTDPPRANGSETHRGWLLVPGFGGPTGGIGWYYCETDSAFGSKPLYDSFDMNKLLQHHSLS